MNSIRLISQGRPFYGKGETKNLVVNMLNKFLRLAIKIKVVLLLFILSGNYSANATHVVGGGITYQQIEATTYLITVKLYKDCSPGTANLPNNVVVQVRRGDGSPSTVNSFNLPNITADTLTPAVPACTFDPGICVQEAIYQQVVNLPPGPGGYHLYFTICCRNGTVQNIVNPLGARETFYAYVPDNNIYISNSSPIFNSIPPVYVCAGDDLNLDFSASEVDGDSLVYSFYTPYDGNNGTGITYGPGIPPNNINISTVNWQPGFGATDPLDGAAGLLPGLTISNNGLINGIPTAPGQYVVGVMIDEYRNGVLIGRITRDFQFNVLNCPPPANAGIDVANNCNGLNIDFTNISGLGATTFWWDFGTINPADSSTLFEPSFTYPAEGTYTVTLIVEKGTACADTITYDVSVMNPVQFTIDIDSVSCNGLNDGQALASAIDPLYLYNWSTLQSGNSINNLPPANYWAAATNTIGCVDTQFFLIEEPNVLDVQINDTEPLCNGDLNGSLNAVVSGGTAPYGYFWPNSGSTSNPLSNIGAGNYDVEITDANGCFATNSIALGQPQPMFAYLISQVNVSCNDFNNGSANVGAIGGSPAYSYFWPALGATTSAVNNLSPGSYVAEITDLNGCLSSLVVDITEPDTLYVDVVVIADETCTSGNGSAFADVTGGIGVISFLWSPSGGTSDFDSGLSAGPIQVIVQDENGCTDQATGVIQNFATGVASIGNATPVSCLNGADGSVEILMAGGTAPFQYNWSCACPNTNVVSNLSAGNYSVEVIDNNGCIDSISFVVNELPAMTLDLVDLIQPTCNSDSDGSIDIIAGGGTAPYSYSWNTNPVQNTPLASGLGAGIYVATAVDANGCDMQLDVVLAQPDVLIADAQVLGNIICFGDSTGVASVQGIGGTAPYTYLWTETSETTQITSNLWAGTFNVTVTDNNGCQGVSSVDIVEYADVHAEIIFDPAFCPGDTVDFYVATNGLNNQYNYEWYVDQLLQGTTNMFSFPIDDTVEVSILLVNTGNCPTVKDTAIVGPIMIPPGNITAFGTPDTVCFGSSAMIHGVITDTAYITSIFWNDSSLAGLGPHSVTPQLSTEYVVTIENVCGEQQSDTIMLNLFMPPNATVIANGTSGCDRVEVNFDFSFDPYDYNYEGAYWSIFNQIYDEESPTVEYTYSVGVPATLYLSFDNGCTFAYDDIVEVEVFESPEANFYFNPDPALQNEITEFIDISHGNPKEWEWYMDGQLIGDEERPSHVFEETGEYTVTEIIIDENGCSDTVTHSVEVIGIYTVYVPNAFTPDGNGVNNTFRPIMTDVVPDNYEFLIFNRWGEVIFRAENLDAEWDGSFLGEAVQDGVYIWKVFVTDNVGLEHEIVGNVTLLR